MEVKKNYAITLNDEGVMDKIMFKENMKVGQKIFYFEEDIFKNATSNVFRYKNFMKSIGSIAALFLIVFTFFHMMKPQEAYAVVSLDINPSIQIEADSKLNIIKVDGVNDDGKNIDFSDIKDIPLEDGMQKIKEKLIEKKYLDTNKDVLVGYAFVKNGDNSAYEEDLMGVINSTFSTQDVTFVKGDKEAVDEAKNKGISLGRYEAALKVEDQTIKNNIDTAPVKEITASIKDKPDVKQWDAQDQKDNDTQDSNEKPEVKNEKPAEKPITNASDKEESNSDAGKDKDKNATNKPDKSSGVLEVQPDVPKQSSSNDNTNTNSGNSANTNSGSTSTPQKDNSITITQDNGTLENNTTSAKIQDDSNKQAKSADSSTDKK